MAPASSSVPFRQGEIRTWPDPPWTYTPRTLEVVGHADWQGNAPGHAEPSSWSPATASSRPPDRSSVTTRSPSTVTFVGGSDGIVVSHHSGTLIRGTSEAAVKAKKLLAAAR